MNRGAAPVQVRCADGDPIEFLRRPRLTRRDGHYVVTEIRDRWIEESEWPFVSPMPIGGDRLRCWRVLAQRSDAPSHRPPAEFVLRMRAGPGVWDLVWPDGDGRP